MAASEAKEHLEAAEKALKPSWMALKFSPDFVSASMDFTQAATKFRAANMLPEAVAAWLRAAETKEAQLDTFGAGRAYESAGAICDGKGPGGPAEAAKHWENAVKCFRLCGKAEIAAKLIMKLAELREKSGDIDGAKQDFETAIEVFEADEKDYALGDVYKQYIGFLVRHERTDDAAKAIDGNVALLIRQKQWTFAHKELLAKAVLFLSCNVPDAVRAENALSPSTQVEGWVMSKECMVGCELVEAYQKFDGDAVQKLVKEQVFTMLQVEIARKARKLQVPMVGGGKSAGDAPTKPIINPTPDDMAESLM